MSILADIKAKLGCRLGELGAPDSIHGTGQTHWLDQLGSTEPSFLLEAQGTPCLSLALAAFSSFKNDIISSIEAIVYYLKTACSCLFC